MAPGSKQSKLENQTNSVKPRVLHHLGTARRLGAIRLSSCLPQRRARARRSAMAPAFRVGRSRLGKYGGQVGQLTFAMTSQSTEEDVKGSNLYKPAMLFRDSRTCVSVYCSWTTLEVWDAYDLTSLYRYVPVLAERQNSRYCCLVTNIFCSKRLVCFCLRALAHQRLLTGQKLRAGWLRLVWLEPRPF